MAHDRARVTIGRVTGHARGRATRLALAFVPLAFLAVFFVYPVATIVGRGLTPGGALDLSPLREVIADPALRHIVWFTVWQATLSTLFTVFVALPGAFVFSRFEVRGPRL